MLIGCASTTPELQECEDREGFVIPVVPEKFSEHCKADPPPNLDEMIQVAAEERGVNPRLLALTVYRESGCNPDLTGSSGEIGLGQINPRSWTKVLKREGIIRNKTELYDPLTNLQSVSYILSRLYKSANGNTLDAIRRYNGSGPRARKYSREQHNLYFSLWGESVRFFGYGVERASG